MQTLNQQPDEELTNLIIHNHQVLQKKQGFRFSIDAILLAHFASIKPNWHVLDIGTGTAVIPLILTTREDSLTIHGVEIQEAIAQMAQRSVDFNGLGDKIHILHHDVKTLPTSYNDQYDLVISNPPYFPVNIGKVSEQPYLALSRHEIACTLEDLLAHSARLLKSNGRIALIHRAQRIHEILALAINHGLAPRRLRFIHPTMTQAANLVLFEAIKGAKTDLTVEPPLAIYTADGQYSQEIYHYYGGYPL